MNRWEHKAIVLYENHPLLHKAVAAGINIDNSLKKEYSKGGHTKCNFPIEQYIAYFAYDTLKSRGLCNNIIASII